MNSTYSSERIEETARKAGREAARSYMRDVEFTNMILSLFSESKMESRIRQLVRSEVNSNLRPLIESELAKSFRDYISRRSELETMVDEHRQKTAVKIEKMRREEEERLSSLRQQSLQGIETALASIEARSLVAAEEFSRKFLRQDTDNHIVRAIEAKNKAEVEAMRAENETWRKETRRHLYLCTTGGLLLGITIATSIVWNLR